MSVAACDSILGPVDEPPGVIGNRRKIDAVTEFTRPSNPAWQMQWLDAGKQRRLC
jgi:hypothetical protein